MASSSLKRGSHAARLMSKRVCWLVYGRGQASTWSDSISCSTVGLATLLFSGTLLTNPVAILTLLVSLSAND